MSKTDTRDILVYPNPALMKKSELVEKVDEEIQQLMDTMLDVMYTAGGMGLAAPQLGIHKRVIVVGIDDDLVCLANPVIASSLRPVKSKEGCLSFPGVNVIIERDSVISVKGLDRENKSVTLNYAGLVAVGIQHEMDHLDGITIAQRADIIGRGQIKKQMKKYNRSIGKRKRR